MVLTTSPDALADRSVTPAGEPARAALTARVVYLSVAGGMGGSEIVLLNLLKGLRFHQPGLDLHVILGQDGPLAAALLSLGARVHTLPLPIELGKVGDSGPRGLKRCVSLVSGLVASLRYAARLRKLLLELQPDVIHSNGIKMHLLSAWIRPSKKLLIWHVHDYIAKRPVTRSLLRRSAGRVQAIICNSADVGTELRAEGIGCEIVTIYNGIDTDTFTTNGLVADLDSRSGLSAPEPGTVRVGLIGTFAKWKGHRTFLEAIAFLSPDIAVRGYIVGAPIYDTQGSQITMEELKGICAELSISEKIGFTGFVENPAAAMRSLDIVVHASTEPEPFGMVIAEALACGRAVIASRAGGAREIFSESVNALGHAPADSQELAACIERLARDCELRKRLGEQGAQDMRTNFGIGRCATEISDLYSRLLNRARCSIKQDSPASRL